MVDVATVDSWVVGPRSVASKPTDSGVDQGSWRHNGRRITWGPDARGVVLADDVAGALDMTTALIAPAFAGAFGRRDRRARVIRGP
ncbi:hypothetical protein [Streptomyces sp. NPDC008141]|uniref:hypothetical protein n=1 Tax=Streptomyces sp. NPDC008141 TaxID=3364815 RepID=UPI0036E1DA98